MGAANQAALQGWADNIEAVLSDLAAANDLVTSLQSDVADLTARLAAAQAIIDQDATAIADLTSQLTAAEQTIADQAAEIQRLEDELTQQGKTPVGAYCGWNAYPQGSETKPQARARVTSLLGGMPVERCFMPWDTPQSGVPAIVSTGFDPASVMSGAHDADIAALAKNPDVSWLCDRHEPDQQGRSYTPAQHIAASTRFYQVAKAANPNCKVGQILMQWSLIWGDKNPMAWLPAADHMDFLGWDVYVEPWQTNITAHKALDPIVAVNRTMGKPMVIAEMGVGKRRASQATEFTDDKKAQLLGDMFTILGDPDLGVDVDAVTFFYTNKDVADWRLDLWPKALAVLKGAVVASLG